LLKSKVQVDLNETLALFLFEHPQVQHASTPIGCLKELLNYHWLLLITCVGITNMLCPLWVLKWGSQNDFGCN
jgi:hypothetical protein